MHTSPRDDLNIEAMTFDLAKADFQSHELNINGYRGADLPIYS